MTAYADWTWGAGSGEHHGHLTDTRASHRVGDKPHENAGAFLVLEAICTNFNVLLQPIYWISQRLPVLNSAQSKRRFYSDFWLYDPTDPAIFKVSVAKRDAYFWQVLIGESQCRLLGFGDKAMLSPSDNNPPPFFFLKKQHFRALTETSGTASDNANWAAHHEPGNIWSSNLQVKSMLTSNWSSTKNNILRPRTQEDSKDTGKLHKQCLGLPQHLVLCPVFFNTYLWCQQDFITISWLRGKIQIRFISGNTWY